MNFVVTPFAEGFVLVHREAGNPTRYFATKEEVQAYINSL